ncbi:MAG: ABC transporter ATP-binding protein [Bdellovibrio sp.]|nr:ABC transporter ATP-binding protein [Bdellovibrio sp.]
MFDFINISKRFKTDFWVKPVIALDSVSFKLQPGTITGFLGANGAGKTTCLKILLGFISQDSGQIEFSNRLGLGLKKFEKIGFFPERPYFYPDLTGREFLEFMGQITNVEKTRRNKNIGMWSAKLKIDQALNRKIRAYSKGMLQRLGLIAAIIHDPELIILDEPMAGLDPIGRKEFKDIFVQLWKEGRTVFFSSHIVSDIEEICSKVIVLEKGKALYQGDIDRLLLSGQSNEEKWELKTNNYINSIGIHKPIQILENKATFQFNKQEVKEVLKYISENNVEIQSLSCLRPSLEEIIYKIKS